MGSDDIFKKRRLDRKKRSHDFKTPKANSYLIITEGKKTEPFYFNGLKQKILKKIGGTVDIVEVPEIDIYGQGTSTERLIEITEEYVNKARIIYQNMYGQDMRIMRLVYVSLMPPRMKNTMLDLDTPVQKEHQKEHSNATQSKQRK